MSKSTTLFSVVGKNVLVTGGSRGIGYMIAKGYVEAGANVIVTSREEKACIEAATTINCQWVQSNVSNRIGCEQLAEHGGNHYQGIQKVIGDLIKYMI
jgi:NAD(P)-dependent dehydrogenase (short-subunit alcohol dehydrogenase family)